ncbi:type 2 periplasmic-binding domain-containing protein [Aquisphaera giovannonii]|uniref:hypothetical protein n=1 Tax=Aquisphaera giovannonii TaxID=406548 RepID=UPI0011DFAD06|nr:hypothetical protein [Aquisphaera giovannonii]
MIEPIEKAGFQVKPPDGWKAVERSRWLAPGTPLAAWAGPDNSSLVVYQTLPAPSDTAEVLAEAMANRLMNLPELTLTAKRTETIAGQAASRVEAVAPGSGAAFAPSGIGKPVAASGETLIPTHRVVVGFPRSDGPVFLAWHAPESSSARLLQDVEATLKGLAIGPDRRRSSQGY